MNAAAAFSVITARGGGFAGGSHLLVKHAHSLTQSSGNARGRTFVLTTKSSTTAASAHRPATFAYTTASRRGARTAGAAAFVRTIESDRHAKSAKAEEFASTTNTGRFASSVGEAAYAHMVGSEASAGNAAAAKSASMAAKGAMCVVCVDKSTFHAPLGVGTAAGSAKAQGSVSMASASINQRASCAKPLLLRVSRKTAQENGLHNPSASSNK